MICPTCSTAADARAPRDQHCSDPKCMCGHRTERYRPLNGLAVIAQSYERLAQLVQRAAPIRPVIRVLAADPDAEPFTFPQTDTTED